ncbi:hypothetical protein [Cobetia amphilecti]|uniref:hypothetical protein n=1 Tax=Cobetia amphilecti TaxID=1055104 RepID=UPI00244B5EEE|nr:hypothetical protein [Cobetia litoralis]MDH2421617.1 hypothetical protein [Cobetia litoralis]
MGDASWLNEIGLNWGWDDKYPDSREKPTEQERWANRASKNRINTDNTEAIKLSQDLIKTRQEIQKLMEKEKSLKKQLTSHMPNLSWLGVTADDKYYIIENLTIHKRPKLITKKAIRFIKNKYGEKAAIALAEECSTKNKSFSSIFIRSFPSVKK